MARKKLSRTFLRIKTQDSIATIEIQQWLPVAALFVFLLWYAASPTKIAAMAAATLLCILASAYVWVFLQARSVDGYRHLRYTALQVGDELEEEITLINRSFLPLLWVEFQDRSNIPKYTVAGVYAADPASTVKWRAHTICARRGVYSLGPYELIMGDPFGIFRVSKVYPQCQEILVYPPLAELPPHLLPHSGIQGDQRPLHQPIRADTTDAVSARPFASGDPLRYIHWRTTARRDAPYVKMFEPEAATSIWLVPDCDAGVHLGSDEHSTFETMILLLAALANEMLHQQLSVGLFASAQEQVIVLPQRGQPHLWEILRALAPLQPDPEHTLGQTLESMRHVVTARSMLLIVTPSLDVSWIPKARILSGIRSAGRSEAILLDPASFGAHGKAETVLPLLMNAGIQTRIIQQGQVIPIVASYGELSRWEFKSLATGRAVARHTPRSAEDSMEPASSRKWREPV